MSTIYSPLRYPGGKNCLFSFISSIFHENNFIGCVYVEPYVGGAGLALRLLFEEYVDNIIINDIDPLVYNFWDTCLNQSERLIRWIADIPITVETWKQCKHIVKDKGNHDTFSLASSFFFLNRTNVSGVLNGGIIGGLNQTGRYKIDARFNKNVLIQRIQKIARYSNRITLTKIDGIELLDTYNHNNANTFIYLDPPYYQKGSNLYYNAYNDDDHMQLATKLANVATPWLLSYDNHTFISNIYSDFEKRSYKLQHSASNKIGDEILVFSHQLQFNNSLSLLNNVALI